MEKYIKLLKLDKNYEHDTDEEEPPSNQAANTSDGRVNYGNISSIKPRITEDRRTDNILIYLGKLSGILGKNCGRTAKEYMRNLQGKEDEDRNIANNNEMGGLRDMEDEGECF